MRFKECERRDRVKGKWFLIPAAIAVAAMVILVMRLTGGETGGDADSSTKTTTTTTTTTTALAEEAVTPDHLSFTGKVLEVDGDSVLMECHDKDKFDTVWVYFAQTEATPQIGQEYTIVYEDMVMPSLPPRITAVEMKLVYSAPLTE